MRPGDHPEGAIASLARHSSTRRRPTSPNPKRAAHRAYRSSRPANARRRRRWPAVSRLCPRQLRKTRRSGPCRPIGGGPSARKALERGRPCRAGVLAAKRQQPARLLLVVDQLDELFGPGMTTGAGGFRPAARSRLGATGAVWIVATLRAEFYEAFLKSPLPLLRRIGGPDSGSTAASICCRRAWPRWPRSCAARRPPRGSIGSPTRRERAARRTAAQGHRPSRSLAACCNSFSTGSMNGGRQRARPYA